MAYQFAVSAIDPDDDTLRYLFDWNNNGIVDAGDEWMPASGYVASGTAQTISHTWTTGGNQTFRVYAQDSKSAMSAGFTTHTVNISAGTLKICSLSCTSGFAPYNTLASFSTMPVTLYACFGTGTCSTGDASVSGTWTANNSPSDAIAISSASGTSTDISRTYTGSGSADEDITLTYNATSVTARAHASCVALTCNSGSIKTQTDAYCATESRTFSDGCGGQTASCPGTRYCDFNWKEVTPGQ